MEDPSRGSQQTVNSPSSFFVRVADFRVFFRRSLADYAGGFAGFPHEVVRNDIHTQLSIPKVILGTLHGHQTSPQRIRNLGTNLQHIRNHLTNLGIGHFRFQHLGRARVRRLLFGGGVERRGGGTVFSVQAGAFGNFGEEGWSWGGERCHAGCHEGEYDNTMKDHFCILFGGVGNYVFWVIPWAPKSK